MAVAYASSHAGTVITDTTVTVTGVTGGTDQTYVLAVGRRPVTTVTGVTGGGLTWTKRKALTGGRAQLDGDMWTASGTPSSDPFSVAVTFTTATVAAAVVTRITGADAASLATWLAANTNGVDGASTGGTDTDDPHITQPVAEDGTLVVNAVMARVNVSFIDADYTAGTVADSHPGGGGARVYVVPTYRLVTTGAPLSDYIEHATPAVTDWLMFSAAVTAAAAPSTPPTRTLMGVGT